MSFPDAPPIRLDPRPWSFPAVRFARAASGLTLAAARAGSLPLAQVRWTFPGGRTREPAPGRARLLAATLRHGTARHSSEGLAGALDDLGLRLRTTVGLDQASLSLLGRTAHLEAMLDFAEEVAFSPMFPEDHLERERSSALEALRQDRAHGEHLAAEWLNWELYGPHPYGQPGATEAGLRGADREGLLALHRALFDPTGALLLVVGDLDPDRWLARLADRYATPPAPSFSAPPTPLATPRPPRCVAVDRPGSEQVSITMGQLLFPRAHADFPAMRLVNQVFGAMAASRLFRELRDRRGLTYGAYSALHGARQGGDLVATLSCSPDRAGEAVRALEAEFERLSAEAFAEDELDLARRYLVGSFPQRSAGLAGLAGLVALAWLQGLPERSWERFPEEVATTSAEAVLAAARRWIRPGGQALVLVGPGEAVRAAAAHRHPLAAEAAAPPFDP